MKRLTTTAIALMLLAGCHQPPTSVLRIDRDAATLAAYGIAQASPGFSATSAVVSTTSIHNDYFDLSLLTDGKLSSAWGPAKTDAAPALLIDLGSQTDLSKLGLKLSLGAGTAPGSASRVLVDVYADDDFVTTLTPGEASPQLFDLDLAAVAQLKLRFRCQEGAIADLLICDLKLIDGSGQEIRVGVDLEQKLFVDLDLAELFDGVWGLDGLADLDQTLRLILEACVRAGVSLETISGLIASCDDPDEFQAQLAVLLQASVDARLALALDALVQSHLGLPGVSALDAETLAMLRLGLQLCLSVEELQAMVDACASQDDLQAALMAALEARLGLSAALTAELQAALAAAGISGIDAELEACLLAALQAGVTVESLIALVESSGDRQSLDEAIDDAVDGTLGTTTGLVGGLL